MKRILLALLCGALAFALGGCADSVGGVYKLDHATANGLRLSPESYGIRIQLQLEDNGVGTATYDAATLNVTWEEDDGTVTLTGPNGVLEFTKHGNSLILHDDGTMLFFEPVQAEK